MMLFDDCRCPPRKMFLHLCAGKAAPVLPDETGTGNAILKPVGPSGIKDRVIVLEKRDEPKPVVRALSEINSPMGEMSLWVSPDGRRIYYARGGNPVSIFVAERPDADSTFGEPKKLIAGLEPTLTADELTLLLVKKSDDRDRSLYVARRSDRNEGFSTPQEIPELRVIEGPYGPFISQDGLVLMTHGHIGSAWGIYVSTRPTTDANWSKPTILQVNDIPKGSHIHWPFLTRDGLTLIAADESDPGNGRFFVWSRNNPQAPFSDRREIKVPGDAEVFGRSPHLVEETGEFFFVSNRPRRLPRYYDQQRNGSDWNLWMIKGFRLEALSILPTSASKSSKPQSEGSASDQAQSKNATAAIPSPRQPVYSVNIGSKLVFDSRDQQTLRRIVNSNRGYKLEGVAFYGLQKEIDGAVPLYRYLRRGDGRHTYLVGDQTPIDGYEKEGDGSPMVWIWKSKKDETEPLYLLGAKNRDVRTLAVGEKQRDRILDTGQWRQHRMLGFAYESAD